MPRSSKLKESICRELATEMKSSIKEVREVVDSQFEKVAKTMEQGEFETIRMPYFGKFDVSEKRLQFLNNKHEIIQRRKLSGDN